MRSRIFFGSSAIAIVAGLAFVACASDEGADGVGALSEIDGGDGGARDASTVDAADAAGLTLDGCTYLGWSGVCLDPNEPYFWDCPTADQIVSGRCERSTADLTSAFEGGFPTCCATAGELPDADATDAEAQDGGIDAD